MSIKKHIQVRAEMRWIRKTVGRTRYLPAHREVVGTGTVPVERDRCSLWGYEGGGGFTGRTVGGRPGHVAVPRRMMVPNAT